jgi:hypothetical protein
MRSAGQVNQLGRSFSWVSAGRSAGGTRRDVEIMVAVRGGRTRITVHESLTSLVGAIFGGIGGGMGGGGMGPIMGIFVGALNVPTLLALIIPAWFATTYVTARTVYTRAVRRRAKEMEDVVDRLGALARELTPVVT